MFSLHSNTVMIKFNDGKDKLRVMNSGPWMICGALLSVDVGGLSY